MKRYEDSNRIAVICFVIFFLLVVKAFGQSNPDSLRREEIRNDFLLVQKQIQSTDSLRIKLQGVVEFLQYKYQAIEDKKKRK